MFNTKCMAGTTYYLMGPTMWKLENMKQHLSAEQTCLRVICEFHIVSEIPGNNRSFHLF